MIYNTAEDKWELEGFGASFCQHINDPVTWNGRNVLFLQSSDCSIPDNCIALAIPEEGDCFLFEAEVEVLYIEEDLSDEDEEVLEEENETQWEIASKETSYAINDQEHLSVEKILARRGLSFNYKEQNGLAPCKSVKKVVRKVKKQTKKTAKKCARFVVKHKKEIIIGVAVAAVVVGVGVIIATAAASAEVAAGTGAILTGTLSPGRRKEEGGGIVSNTGNSAKNGDPHLFPKQTIS